MQRFSGFVSRVGATVAFCLTQLQAQVPNPHPPKVMPCRHSTCHTWDSLGLGTPCEVISTVERLITPATSSTIRRHLQPIMVQKVMGQHLFLNIIPNNFTAATKWRCWCDRDMKLHKLTSGDLGSRVNRPSIANDQFLIKKKSTFLAIHFPFPHIGFLKTVLPTTSINYNYGFGGPLTGPLVCELAFGFFCLDSGI